MLFLLQILHALIICVYFIILGSGVERGNRWFYYTIRVFPLIFVVKHFFTSTNSTRSFTHPRRLDIDYSRQCNGLLRFPDMLACIAVVLKKLNCKELHAVKTTSANGFFCFYAYWSTKYYVQ